MSTDTTRRRIIKGAGVAAVAAVATGMHGQARAAEPRETVQWDRVVDIVCVGGGAASLTAAAIATARGAEVAVLEKGPVLGGTTAKSGAVFWIPNHFLLREKGVVDAKADALRYMCRYSYSEYYDPSSPTLGLDPAAYARIEAFYDNGHVMVDELRRIGALGVTQFNAAFGGDDPLDYQSHMPENKTPAGRPLCPQKADGSQGGGPELIQQLGAFLEARKVPVLTDHRVTRLHTENGAVIGVAAEYEGATVNIRARRAVIFGTGGYANNVDLVTRYQQPFAYGACATTLATGDFVGIAAEVGAQLGNMESAWRSTVVFEEAVQNRAVGLGSFVQPGDSMFVVNKYGRRIVNEKRNYNDRTRIHQVFDPNTGQFPNLLSFYIYDRRTAEAYAGNFPLPRPGTQARHVITGATLAELSERIAERLAQYASKTGGLTLDPGFASELEKTFARFNAFARAGKDEDFGRGDFDYDRQWAGFFGPMRKDTDWKPNDLPNSALYPLQESGPYHCIILAPGLLDTNGGPIINEKAQVLAPGQRAIPGLYGAGNCIASPSRAAYYGAGATIGLAMTFGYIAATNAMQEPVRDA
jgi:succinate dehydrogenase/fumarate reductase flavoprotein subunit